jgi:hypothetical protein
MVNVIDVVKRQDAAGKEFYCLILNGDLEFVQSAKTKNWYATALKTSITTTFPEQVCKSLIGKTLPGEIQRVEVDPYEFTIEETGEVITLTHRSKYNPKPLSVSTEEAVFEGVTEAKMVSGKSSLILKPVM